jgi:hypothetical protein
MTIKRRRYGRTGFGYKIDGESVPGVTKVLGMMPRDNLIKWAAESTADYTLNHWDELAQMPYADRLKAMYGSRFLITQPAAKRGTEVHAFAAQLAEEELDWSLVPPELRGHVEACADWLDSMDVAALENGSELVVASREHLYCGSADLVADLAALRCDRELIPPCRWLVEVKTTAKGPFPESALQATAYQHADVYVHPDYPDAEQPMSLLGIERCGVLQLASDDWAFYPVDTGPDVWETFLRLRWLFDQEDSGAMRGWVGTPAEVAHLAQAASP